MTLPSATELFGETVEGLELHNYPIKGGTAYWITQDIDNTRRKDQEHTLTIVWDDGEPFEPVTLEGEAELKLWTEHLA
jgi:hypothetical protein